MRSINQHHDIPGLYDMPTLLPHMIGFNNFFMQSSLGKILINQLHAKQQQEQQQSQLNNHRNNHNHHHHHHQHHLSQRLDETGSDAQYDALSQQSEAALSPSTTAPDSEGTTTEGTEGGKESPAPPPPPPPALLPFHHESQGLDAVRRLLETVNTSVTKQLLEANVRKLASSPAMVIKREADEDYQVLIDFNGKRRILLTIIETKF